METTNENWTEKCDARCRMKLWGCVRCGGLFARRMLAKTAEGFLCRVGCNHKGAT